MGSIRHDRVPRVCAQLRVMTLKWIRSFAILRSETELYHAVTHERFVIFVPKISWELRDRSMGLAP
jgi:hypothetical protein